MGVYRFEISQTSRAVCKATDCKKEGIKILKGELRYGTQVDYDGNPSWQWRHWGCVTPTQIANLRETTNGDLDYVDGYDEVAPEMQEKIKRALDQGHIDDEDWKGDIELNRPGQKGKRKPVPKKRKGTIEDENGDQGGISPSKAPKKRGRVEKDDGDGDEKPKLKKAKPANKKAKQSDDESKPAPKKTKPVAKKGKKDKEGEDGEDGEDGEEIVPKKTKAATKKGKKGETGDEGEELAPKKTKPVAKKGKKDGEGEDGKEIVPRKTKAATKKGKEGETADEGEELALEKNKAAIRKGKAEDEGEGSGGPLSKKSEAVNKEAAKDGQPTKEKKASKKPMTANAKGKKGDAVDEKDSTVVTPAEEAAPYESKIALKKTKSKVKSSNTRQGEEATASVALSKARGNAAQGGNTASGDEELVEETANSSKQDHLTKPKRGRKRVVQKDTNDASQADD